MQATKLPETTLGIYIDGLYQDDPCSGLEDFGTVHDVSYPGNCHGVVFELLNWLGPLNLASLPKLSIVIRLRNSLGLCDGLVCSILVVI